MSKEKQLDDVLREYIEECPDFEHLQDDDKIFIYSSLKKILKLLHLVIKYPNVNPILFVHSIKTKSIGLTFGYLITKCNKFNNFFSDE